MSKLLETERLTICQFTYAYQSKLTALLSDVDVMKYYPSVLSREACEKWLDRIVDEYDRYGVSWWAVHAKESGDFIGQAGILFRIIEGEGEYHLAYMFDKKYWGRGYATEAAREIVEFGLETLELDKILCLVRAINTPSKKLACRLGLTFERTVMYFNLEHEIYVAYAALHPC